MSISVVNLADKFKLFSDHWSPKVVGRLNGQAVKIVKVKGEFVKHTHIDEDELFFIIEGVFYLELEQETLELKAGEFVIIPKGVEHRPFAPEEVKLMLFEPDQIKHTGEVEHELTQHQAEEI